MLFLNTNFALKNDMFNLNESNRIVMAQHPAVDIIKAINAKAKKKGASKKSSQIKPRHPMFANAGRRGLKLIFILTYLYF